MPWRDLNNWLFNSELANVIQVLSFPSLIVAFCVFWRKFNCTEKRCWRIGKHQVKGTTFHTCAKHTTGLVHRRLFARHAVERPEQHEFLNPS